jgi:hypothetical protein
MSAAWKLSCWETRLIWEDTEDFYRVQDPNALCLNSDDCSIDGKQINSRGGLDHEPCWSEQMSPISNSYGSYQCGPLEYAWLVNVRWVIEPLMDTRDSKSNSGKTGKD